MILCSLINALKPNSVPKINPANGMKFKEVVPFLPHLASLCSDGFCEQMENIGAFLKGSALYGVKQTDLFQSPDLYEGA